MLAGYGHLLESARRLQWDAGAIDLSHDRAALKQLAPARRRRVEAMLAGFWVAEHQVAEQLAPFLAAAAGEARACFERQARDERRHAQFFDRVLREVLRIGSATRARELAGAEIVRLFEHELPAMAAELSGGDVGLTDAVGLYHVVLEGIVLSAGEEALLHDVAPLPGVAAGVARVQADERWHVGLGVTVLCDAGVLAPGVPELAQRAAAAWGPEIATPERIERVLATHRRRLRLLERHAGAAAARGAHR